jgi:hypothetical protein
MFSRPKRLEGGCRQVNSDGDLARADAGVHNYITLRLKDNLLPVVKGEGETFQDTLADERLVT